MQSFPSQAEKREEVATNLRRVSGRTLRKCRKYIKRRVLHGRDTFIAYTFNAAEELPGRRTTDDSPALEEEGKNHERHVEIVDRHFTPARVISALVNRWNKEFYNKRFPQLRANRIILPCLVRMCV